MDIYIKPMQKALIVQKKAVFLKDVAEVYFGGQKTRDAENIIVFTVPEDKKKTYLLSVMELIRMIHQKYPDATVSNLGEMDILIEYLPQPKKQTALWTGAKVLFVSLVLFVGSTTTIMCFHSDTQLPLIFQNVYYIFFRENKDMPAMLSIPYSLGVGLGIIIFFNHFSKLTLTEDPTPIEIEMTTYEKETNASIVDYLEQKKKGGQ